MCETLGARCASESWVRVANSTSANSRASATATTPWLIGLTTDRFWWPTADAGAAGVLETPLLERAIGVIYRPQTERASHYFPARLDQQFDVVVHLDRTSAMQPLDHIAAWDPLEPRRRTRAGSESPAALRAPPSRRQWPANSGGRFSTNAAAASRWSAVPIVRTIADASASSASASVEPSARLTFSFM